MDWEVESISLYLLVYKHYRNNLSTYCQRMSNYSDLKFSDEEAITLYLYGVIEGYRTLKSIHRYAKKHLMSWFPHLPKYGAFDEIISFIPFNMLICYAYKAYQVENEPIHQEQKMILLTPVKKEKAQKFLDAADQWLSAAISQVRQPIESFFNWVNERTGIQIAIKVRSYLVLMVHVFGRLAAVLFIMRDKMITGAH